MQFFPIGSVIPVKRGYKSALFLLLAALLISGCIKAEHPGKQPLKPPLAFSYSGQEPTKSRWWLEFDDQELNQLITTATTENFTLLVARDRIAEAEALARISGAALSPSLDLAAAAASDRNYQQNFSTDRYSLSLAAAYEIDLWRRLRNAKDAAVFELKASVWDYATAELSLAAQLTSTWFQLGENRKQQELVKEQTRINEKVLKVIDTRFRAGKTGIADVLQQRQLVESNQEDLAVLRSSHARLGNQLLALLGKPPQQDWPQVSTLPALPPLPKIPLPADLLLRRPDVQQRALQMAAADLRVAVAIAERLPRLSISADLSTTGSRSSDLFNNWFTSLGASLFGPVIDGGRRLAEVDRRKAIARQRYNQYGQTLLDALVEVEEALIVENELNEILISKEIQKKLAAESIEHVGNRYRQGAEDYQRVLLALLSLQNLERDILRSRLRLLQNRITLYRAISGPLPQLPMEQQILSTNPPAPIPDAPLP